MALSEGGTCKRVREAWGFTAWAVTWDSSSMRDLGLPWSYRAHPAAQPGGNAVWDKAV